MDINSALKLINQISKMNSSINSFRRSQAKFLRSFLFRLRSGVGYYAHPYKRDLPEVEFHLLDTGHFAIEDQLDTMVPLIRDFLARKIASA